MLSCIIRSTRLVQVVTARKILLCTMYAIINLTGLLMKLNLWNIKELNVIAFY